MTKAPTRPMTSGVASLTLDMRIGVSRGAVRGRPVPANR
jgi:hypothetical protein